MNKTLASFLDGLTTMPHVSVCVDLGVKEDAPTWFDLRCAGKSATVEYRPQSGFGLYTDEVDDYGTGPTEIYRAVEPLLIRLDKHFGSHTSGSISLRDLRELRSITQEQLGGLAGKKQSAISKVEARDKLLLGTLVEYVEALGGNVRINVHFKDFDVPLRVPFSDARSRPRRAGSVAWTNRPAPAVNDPMLEVQWTEGPLLFILRQRDETGALQLTLKPSVALHVSAGFEWLHWFGQAYKLTLRGADPATWDVALPLRTAQLLVARMTAEVSDKSEDEVLPWVS
ncbi:MAG: helix-turn-helix domain-containing protein [Gammaproteobacteria bacterium]